jgi:hypothetical protein
MLLLERSVAKKRPVGRPAAFEGGTRQVKLPEDLVQMMQWLTRLEGGTLAQIIDPLVRPEVEKRFSRRQADIVAIKVAEDAAAKASGRDPSPPLPNVRNWTREALEGWESMFPKMFPESYTQWTQLGDKLDELKSSLEIKTDSVGKLKLPPKHSMSSDLAALVAEYRRVRKEFEKVAAVIMGEITRYGESIAAKYPPIEDDETPSDHPTTLKTKKPKK